MCIVSAEHSEKITEKFILLLLVSYSIHYTAFDWSEGRAFVNSSEYAAAVFYFVNKSTNE